VVDSGFLPCRCHMLRNICRGLNTGACAKVRNLRDMRYAKLQMMDLIACGGTLAEGKRQSVKVDKEKCKHNKRENASKKETNKKKQHSTRNLTSTGGAQNKASTVLRGHLQSRCHNEQKPITIRGSSEGRKDIGNPDWKSSFRLGASGGLPSAARGPPGHFIFSPGVQKSF
jgi:hypothetical protein